jgi:hypothetical protein
MALIVKVYDDNCEICKQMERHDRVIFEEFPDVVYRKAELNDLLDNERDATKQVIYQCLERYCLTATYEVDLPTYLFLTDKGKYLGHHTGAATVVELRNRVKTLLPSKSEDP